MDKQRDADRLTQNWTQAGRVLRSVTHDVNNHLGAILAFAELIAMAPDRSRDVVGMAKEIVLAVRASATQLDTVAAIVSDDLDTIETIHLNEVLPRVSSLFRFELDRAGSGIDLALSDQVCAFPGVRARFVRALVHVFRYASGTIGAAKTPRHIAIVLTQHTDKFTIDIGGNAGFDEVPDELSEAREHIRYHRGELKCAGTGSIRIEIPRDTGLLTRPGNR